MGVCVAEKPGIISPPPTSYRSTTSVVPVAWSMAPTGTVEGLGEATGALGTGLADALDAGDTPLEPQATTMSAIAGRRAWRVSAGMATGRRVRGIGSQNRPERGNVLK